MNTDNLHSADHPHLSHHPDPGLTPHPGGMPVVAVVGDGQLARMLAPAASELGQSLRVLASAPDSSAAQVTADVVIGDYTNIDDVRQVAQGADVVTFDHEHVPYELLQTLHSEGVNLQPGPEALLNAQDKLHMRRSLQDIGAPIPPFAAIDSVTDATAFWNGHDGQVCLKARRGGYDGKGVWFPKTCADFEQLVEGLLSDGVELLAEARVDFDRELSAMVARAPSGQVQAWPVVESVQRDGVCSEVIAPASGLDDDIASRASQLAVLIAENLGVTGVLAVELFYFHDAEGNAQISVNELAMRPHNTGHWSQDGCITPQFEQHLRAVMDYPLGDTHAVRPVAVMVNVLGGKTDPPVPFAERVRAVWHRFPHAKIHLYGKDYRPGRKMGHVTMYGQQEEQIRREASLAAHYLINARWADGYQDRRAANLSTTLKQEGH